MHIDSTGLIYFSPTGTTRKIIESISQGVQYAVVRHVDLTPNPSALRIPRDFSNGLAIIGSPVYGGRLPAAMVSRFRKLEGNCTPAVIVVVYGNRDYEDALLELRDIALEGGFVPIAAGAFIGEHSYSTGRTPIAAGRPDAEDIQKAEAFGRKVREKLDDSVRLNRDHSLKVPGNYPYNETQMLSDISPATQETLCIGCKKCVSVCPVAAIDADDPSIADNGPCIRCCACIKNCPVGAKMMEDPRIKQVAALLAAKFNHRREPEIYL